MVGEVALRLICLFLLSWPASLSASDSLRPALRALRKRQQDLLPPPAPAPIYYSPSLYGDGQPENIGYGYQKSGVLPSFAAGPSGAAAMTPGGSFLPDKRGSSVFRERSGPDPAQTSVDLLDESEDFYREEPSLFRERLHTEPKHRSNLAMNSIENDPSSEDEYLSILNDIWEKYREQDPEEVTVSDVEDLLDYLAEKQQNQKRQYSSNYDTGYDFFNSPLNWNKRLHNNHSPVKKYQETLFDERYPYKSSQKRFPITKRSPNSISTQLNNRRTTDPKTAAELTNIFSTDNKNKSETKKNETKLENSQKEELISKNISNDSLKPIQIKKKSIKWSDYFGLDRRKKSASVPNENWLIDQYAEAYNSNGDSKNNEIEDGVDRKMRAMEELILDEALKYTGAHEGTTDRNEIQRVKDKVLAQLAAAYSLEKMRRALGEFKASLAAQHKSNKPVDLDNKPKKMEIDKIDSQEKSHKLGKSDTVDLEYGAQTEKECPLLLEAERRCAKISSLGGDSSNRLVPVCTLHALCRICGDWLHRSSPEQCDSAFADEAESECEGDQNCLRLAKQTLNLARSLPAQSRNPNNGQNSPGNCLCLISPPATKLSR